MSKLPFDFEAYKEKLGFRESTNNWKARNKLGYVGRYQLGAPALIDAGLVKPGTTNAGLKNKNNWLHGLSLNSYLNSPSLQDKALFTYTSKNYNALASKGMVNEDMHPGQVAGYLGAAHLVGATGAEDALVKGKDITDANNVKPQEYAQMMHSTFGYKPESVQMTKQPVASINPQEFLSGSIDKPEEGGFASLANEWLKKAKSFYGGF